MMDEIGNIGNLELVVGGEKVVCTTGVFSHNSPMEYLPALNSTRTYSMTIKGINRDTYIKPNIEDFIVLAFRLLPRKRKKAFKKWLERRKCVIITLSKTTFSSNGNAINAVKSFIVHEDRKH